MADPVIPPDPPATTPPGFNLSSLGGLIAGAVTTGISQGFEKAIPGLVGGMIKGVTNGMSSTADGFLETIKGIRKREEKDSQAKGGIGEIKKISFKDLFGDGVKQLGKNLQEEIDSVTGETQYIKTHFDVDLENELMPALDKFFDQPIFSGDNLIKVGAIFVADKAIAGAKAAMGPFLALEKKINDLETAGLQATAGMAFGIDTSLGPIKLGNSYENARGAVDSYRQAVARTVNATGKDWKTAGAEIKVFADQGLSISAMEDFSLEAKGATGAATGFAAAMQLSAATGLSTAEIAQNIALQTRALGVETEDTSKIYGAFADISGKYNVRVQDIAKGTFAAADSLKFFGNTTKGVTELYNKMIGSLGKGKETLAMDLVQQLTQGLSKMDAGLRSFIGMTSGIGKGRGAIGGGLEVEEAMASGDLSGITNAITEQIEKISGGKMMSRREALDTGKEQQFFLQRELVKQQLGLGDQEASQFMESVSKGLQTSIADLRPDQGLSRISETGKSAMDIETGPGARMFNMAEMNNAISMTGGIAKDMQETSRNMTLASKTYEHGSTILETIFGNASSTSMEQIKDRLKDLKEPISAKPEDMRESGKQAGSAGTRSIDITKSLELTLGSKQAEDATARREALVGGKPAGDAATRLDTKGANASKDEAARIEAVTGAAAAKDEEARRRNTPAPINPAYLAPPDPSAMLSGTTEIDLSANQSMMADAINQALADFASGQYGPAQNIMIQLKLDEKIIQEIAVKAAQKPIQDRQNQASGGR